MLDTLKLNNTNQKFLITTIAGSHIVEDTVKEIPDKLSSKQNTAFMANFIHSLDSYLVYKTVESFNKANKPLICIFDCWGIFTSDKNFLILELKNLYKDMLLNNKGYNYFKNQWIEQLTNSVNKEIANEFATFLDNRIPLGTLSIEDIDMSKYFIYYE